jgi:hypothetical protein
MIERVYAAALDPARWRDFTNSVGEHFRDGSTMLWHANQIAASHRYEAKVLRALEDRYAAINPWMPKKMLMSSGTLHRTEELYPEDELARPSFTPISWRRTICSRASGLPFSTTGTSVFSA